MIRQMLIDVNQARSGAALPMRALTMFALPILIRRQCIDRIQWRAVAAANTTVVQKERM
jgi:hypothetical protein